MQNLSQVKVSGIPVKSLIEKVRCMQIGIWKLFQVRMGSFHQPGISGITVKGRL